MGDETGRVIRHEHGWLEWRHAPGNTAEIVNVEVDPARRREGVGRALLMELCRALPRDCTVYAVTQAGNTRAHAWYKGTGFYLCGLLCGFYGNDPKAIDARIYARKAGV